MCAQGDDLTERFFRNLTELAVIHCLNSERPAAVPRSRSSTLSPRTLSSAWSSALSQVTTALPIKAPHTHTVG